ncbi:MAG: HAD family acid phosphatase [Gemmatimonadota bacterium]
MTAPFPSRSIRFLGLLVGLVLIASALLAPGARAAVVQFDFGQLTPGTKVVGSDQHLPPLAVPGPYIVSPAIGADIVALRNSGGYTADIRGTVALGRRYLNRWLNRKCQTNATPAQVKRCRVMAVFDMDDTLESWYQYYSSPTVNWVADQSAEEVVMEACGNPAIPSTIALLQHALSRGVAVSVITGRRDTQRSFTATCLDQLGAGGYRNLIVRDPANYETTAAAFKAQARKKLERKGWRIAISVGDQVSDMSGGYVDAGFLLPNPMYFIP